MTELYCQILQAKTEAGLTWNELAAKAKIPLSSWMTGAAYCAPSDKELKAISKVLGIKGFGK